MRNSFYKDVMAIVFPITVQMFMLSLVSATDALMLGLLDQVSLSSVSLASQVQFVFSLFVTGIAGGLSILMAQYFGKRDFKALETIVPIPMSVNIVFSLIFTVSALFVPELLMRFFTNELVLIEMGSAYLKAVALSYLFCGISQIYLAIFRNTGEAKAASFISSFAVVFNIVFDAIFIFGLFGLPKMGIVGAAYATVLARLIELFLCVIKKSPIHIYYSRLFKRAGILEKDFWFYCTPVLLASLVWGGAFTLYSVIMGHLGNDVVAAYSIAGIVKQLTSCLVRALGTGTSVYIGNELGAGKIEEAKIHAKELVKLSLYLGLATGFLMLVSIPFVHKIVVMSETSHAYLTIMMVITSINLVGQSVNITVLDGVFAAGGDSKFDMYGNIGAMWCFAVPLGFLSAFVLKLPLIYVFIIVNLDEFVKMPAVFKRYKKYIWLRNITRENI